MSELHIFVDSCETSYSCVAYLRSEMGKSNTCTQVAAKTKVSPILWTSIPYLELLSAVLGVNLGKMIERALKIAETTYWSDSLDVLNWIGQPSRGFKPFVAHRIGQIHQDSNPINWRYVPSVQNPADIGARGCSVDELINNDMWENGPNYLKCNQKSCPSRIKQYKTNVETKKRKNFGLSKEKSQPKRNEENLLHKRHRNMEIKPASLFQLD